MLKRWCHSFDPKKEQIQRHHFWVLLPSLPLEFWNKETIMAIKNTLGCFFHVEPNILTSEDKRIGKFSIEIDVH